MNVSMQRLVWLRCLVGAQSLDVYLDQRHPSLNSGQCLTGSVHNSQPPRSIVFHGCLWCSQSKQCKQMPHTSPMRAHLLQLCQFVKACHATCRPACSPTFTQAPHFKCQLTSNHPWHHGSPDIRGCCHFKYVFFFSPILPLEHLCLVNK